MKIKTLQQNRNCINYYKVTAWHKVVLEQNMEQDFVTKDYLKIIFQHQLKKRKTEEKCTNITEYESS